MSNAKTAQKITKEMTIDDILSNFPHKGQRMAQEITNAGLHCVGCHAATWETLEAGMLGHGMTEEDVERLVDRLNTALDEPMQDPKSITLTERAAKKYRKILEEDGKAGWGLRFAERAAGCSGFEYLLDYQEKALPDDEIFLSQGVEIYVNKGLVSRLLGCEIDYVDGLQGAGFKISNPHVRSNCGCGTSHGY